MGSFDNLIQPMKMLIVKRNKVVTRGIAIITYTV